MTISFYCLIRTWPLWHPVLRGVDSDDSDLDLLVDPTSETTLMDIAAIQVALERLLGVSVDVLTPNALPDKFRSQVLAEAEPV